MVSDETREEELERRLEPADEELPPELVERRALTRARLALLLGRGADDLLEAGRRVGWRLIVEDVRETELLDELAHLVDDE
jgi:hypothetical protein